jgi:hypothetical protein
MALVRHRTGGIMKVLAAIPMLALFISTGANAQATMTINPPFQNNAFGIDPIVRITTTFRTAVTPTDSQAGPDAKAQEVARRALYGMAENECTVLSEVFKAECRLNSLSSVTPAVAPPSNILSATAVYELKPRTSAAAR